MKTYTDTGVEPKGTQRSDKPLKYPSIALFLLAVLGFSFWFFLAVPFASHRESYGWLAGVRTQDFTQAFSVISVTYRPLAQSTAWLGFMILNPSIFPTSVLRETFLQGVIYSLFVLAWWLIYSAAPQKRLFALVAFIAGGVFFSGYVHLFHIYGIFYVPVILTLGASLRLYVSGAVDKREVWLAAAALVFVFWHPFATALFLGFYSGYYLDTFRRRSMPQHVRALLILVLETLAVFAMVVVFSRPDVMAPLHSKMTGFLESYRTNEVNGVASVVAFLFTELLVISMRISTGSKALGVLVVAIFSTVFFLQGIPVLLLWVAAALLKLARMRCWSLFFFTLAAAVLPIGAGIGGPVSALFAIILAAYATPLGWPETEKALSFVGTRSVTALMAILFVLLVTIRAGVNVPVVTRLATPLLTERERTYQLEQLLAWLHDSEYSGAHLAFAQSAGSPIDSAENVLTRENRPPAAIGDVALFWDTVLRRQSAARPSGSNEVAIVTFGRAALADATPVFKVDGRYAGYATIWIKSAPR